MTSGPSAAPSTVAATTTASPLGPLLMLSDGPSYMALTGLFMTPFEDHRSADQPAELAPAALFCEAADQLAAYFAGSLRDFDLPLAPRGTAFQRRVWQALREIPYGQTVSYSELAAQVGNARACRAVGLANGRNPISIVVPCHRVIGADGTLTGYGGGLDRKRRLLALEADTVGAGLSYPTEL